MVKTKGWDMPWNENRHRWDGRIRIRDLKMACEVHVMPFHSRIEDDHFKGFRGATPGLGLIEIVDEATCPKLHRGFQGDINHLPAILEDLRGLGGSILNIDEFVAIMDRYGYANKILTRVFHLPEGKAEMSFGSTTLLYGPSSLLWERKLGVKFDFTKEEWVLSAENNPTFNVDFRTGEISWI